MSLESFSLANFTTDHLDAILAATHMLPRQTDVSGLLFIVKYCTAHLLAFQRLCLLIETPLCERDRMYSLEIPDNSALCSRLEMGDDEGRYTIFRQLEPRLLTSAEWQRDFPTVAKLPFSLDLQKCLLLPLSIGVNGYEAVLLFIWTQETQQKPNNLSFCRTLASIVSSCLTQLLTSEEQNMEIEVLRKERDHLNLLVNVANIAASTLDQENLVRMVALDLRRFFEVNDVALELYEEKAQVSVYHVLSQVTNRMLLSRKSALVNRLHFEKPFCLVREKALQEVRSKDPLVAALLANGDTTACVFSLTVQQKTFGALILAHNQAEVFTRDTVTLLVKIARTLAQSLDNARKYASMDTTRQRLAQENTDLTQKIVHQRRQNSVIIGQSEAIRKVLEHIEMVAASDSTVLILGETGTGKELVAEAIHRSSQRKSKPLVKINCAALPPDLLERELFGSEKLAGSDGLDPIKGRFEQAQNGTLFLDEVGDLPLDLQSKLLRVLQSQELVRVGGQTPIAVNVRLIAATQQNLVQMVAEKRFREDLYYRLNIFPLTLPPLRERRDDIPLLAQHFMEILSQRMHKDVTCISSEALRWLCRQDWPGNVRELLNVIERAVICSQGKLLNLVMETSSQTSAVEAMPQSKKLQPASKAEAGRKEEMLAAILACNGLIAGPRGAAAYLGLKRTTFNSRLKRLGLDVKTILAQGH